MNRSRCSGRWLSRRTMMANFREKLATDGSQAIVFTQTSNNAEIENAIEAIEECPVEAIHRD